MTTTSPTLRPRHEIRALLRAHLSASARYRHLTRHCAVCHRLLRLTLESAAGGPAPIVPQGGTGGPGEGSAA
ncbi:DUF6274 family protein [Streptomyces sp. URMC 126]|uniref:DUF6274 family protein n=1 Tax=Streptomyces sp. URMC 126 TaxID=3423401 RepID=UPI003F194A45